MGKNKCDNRAHGNLPKRRTSHRCSTRKPAAPDILFDLLKYGTLLSLNGVVGEIIVVRRERRYL